MSELEKVKFWLNNISVALQHWAAVVPEQVDLASWSTHPDNKPPECGTTACFGGHLVHWPHFKGLGVTASWDGSPTTQDPDVKGLWYSPNDVSNNLFGHRGVFEWRGNTTLDFLNGWDDRDADGMLIVSDWELVRLRLDTSKERHEASLKRLENTK